MNLHLSHFNETLHAIRQALTGESAAPPQRKRERPYPDLTPAQRAFRKARMAKAGEVARDLEAKRHD